MRKVFSSRSAFSVWIIVGVMYLLGHGLSGQEQDINWERVEIAARTYFEYPSSENARLLYQVLPEQPLRGDVNPDHFYRLFNFMSEKFDVLERQVSVGDREAVKLGFRLYNFYDGLHVMHLDRIMADLVRSHPQLYLEELKSSPNAQRIKELGYPLSDSSFDSEGKWEALRYELEMRVKALESVTDNALIDLRDTCLKEIRVFTTKYYHDPPRVVLGEMEYLPLFKKAVIYAYNEAEVANQICQCIIELEEASKASPFGATSGKIVHSSGLFDELTVLKNKSLNMLDELANPPLAYAEEYSALKKMILEACWLCEVAKDPSIISPSDRSSDFKKSTYKKSTAWRYGRFKDAYNKLAILMPAVNQEVQMSLVDIEAIKKRLK
jgi:hypothetical protein